MSVRKRDRIKVEAILWNDAVGSGTAPLAIPTLDFGVVVNENDEELTMAHEIFADGGIRDRTTVSKTMLIRRWVLKTMIAPAEFARYELRKVLVASGEDFSWRKKHRS